MAIRYENNEMNVTPSPDYVLKRWSFNYTS